MPIQLQVGAKKDIGRSRDHMEDDYGYVEPRNAQEEATKGWLYVVADGVGGHLAGDRASDLAVSIITHEYCRDSSPSVEESLRRAIEAANARIHHEAQEAEKEGMATTCVCVVVRDGKLHVAHVGDSRAFLIREGVMQQLTKDHSWVSEQVERGILTEEEAENHPYRNVITRSLGTNPEMEPDFTVEDLRDDDAILLCTDGLYEQVEGEQIRDVILANEPQTACDLMIEMANTNGGSDNITAMVVRASDVGKPPRGAPEEITQWAACKPGEEIELLEERGKKLARTQKEQLVLERKESKGFGQRAIIRAIVSLVAVLLIGGMLVRGLIWLVRWYENYSSRAVAQPTPAAIPTGTPVLAAVAIPISTPTPTPLPTPTGTPTLTVEEQLEQLKRGLDAPWDAKDWEEVIRLVEQIRAINPDYDDMVEKLYAAHVKYGRQLADEGRLGEAKKEFSRALAIKPNGVEAMAELRTFHVVQPGETLFRLALRYDTTVEAIMAANGLTDYNIYAGQ